MSPTVPNLELFSYDNPNTGLLYCEIPTVQTLCHVCVCAHQDKKTSIVVPLSSICPCFVCFCGYAFPHKFPKTSPATQKGVACPCPSCHRLPEFTQKGIKRQVKSCLPRQSAFRDSECWFSGTSLAGQSINEQERVRGCFGNVCQH